MQECDEGRFHFFRKRFSPPESAPRPKPQHTPTQVTAQPDTPNRPEIRPESAPDQNPNLTPTPPPDLEPKSDDFWSIMVKNKQTETKFMEVMMRLKRENDIHCAQTLKNTEQMLELMRKRPLNDELVNAILIMDALLEEIIKLPFHFKGKDNRVSSAIASAGITNDEIVRAYEVVKAVKEYRNEVENENEAEEYENDSS